MSTLPNWDLSDLYSGINDNKIKQDLTNALSRAKRLEDSFKGKIESSSGDAIAVILKDYEDIAANLGRVATFAYLNFSTNMLESERSEFYQNSCDEINEVSKHLIFLGLELAELSDDVFQDKLKSTKLAHYNS